VASIEAAVRDDGGNDETIEIENRFVGYKTLIMRLDVGLVRSMGLCASASLSTGKHE